MRNKFTHLFLAVFLLTACSEPSLSDTKGAGGVRYGGEFRFMSSEKVTSIFPAASTDIYSQRLVNQVFESLLKIDQSGTRVIPSLAESFTVSSDARQFTFQIRKGVFFHDDPCFPDEEGREVTADDVKYSLEFACSGLPENDISNLLINRIKGAKQFHAETQQALNKKGVSGIQVVNKHTLVIELVEPFVDFDKALSHSGLGIFPREAYKKYGHEILRHPVGTGPFSLETWTGSKITLIRNPHYWKKDDFGNQLPFLERVIMTYANNKRSELLAFRKAEIDLVLRIPVEEIENILGTLQEAQAGLNVKHKVDSKSSMSLTYFGFAQGSAPFSDIRVRKAFNLALDRNELVNNWLGGEGYPSLNGFVPPMEGYTHNRVKGFPFDVPQARKLLAQAGFPDGRNFPVLNLYLNGAEGTSIHRLASGVIDQLKKNLNVDVKIHICSIRERETAIKNGKALFWRTGWIADYPDPENFLSLFYNDNAAPGGFSNPFKYSSKQFDAYYEAACKEKNPRVRNALMVKCDQTIIDDAAVMPLVNEDFITMINSRIKNFETNSMEILDFSNIFIKEPRK